MEHANPFRVSPQRRDRGAFNWLSEEEMHFTPRIPFQAAMALAKNSAISEAGLNQLLLPAMDILPERCFVSPVVAMLTYNKEKPYVPLVSTTLQVIWELQQIRLWFYAKNRYFKSIHDTRGKELETVLLRYERKEQVDWNNALAKALNEFYGRVKERNTKILDEFAALMHTFTFKHIRLLEKTIYDCMCIYARRSDLRFIPSTDAAVPLDYPYDNEKERAAVTLNMRNWFQSKQSIIIASCGIDVYHIEADAICPIMEKDRANPEVVYREFLPYHTLWQYAMLLDDDGILGKVSKGVAINGRKD